MKTSAKRLGPAVGP